MPTIPLGGLVLPLKPLKRSVRKSKRRFQDVKGRDGRIKRRVGGPKGSIKWSRTALNEFPKPLKKTIGSHNAPERGLGWSKGL